MRSGARICAAGALLTALAGCAAGGAGAVPPASRSIETGPAADYPVLVGDPYFIDGEEHVPLDRLNYDAVGYAAMESGEEPGITLAHKTLPLPSYVELTALDSGRTILARVERRGPMRNDPIVALSRGAAEQLGLSADGPVRVRRVVPPEAHRAELRADRSAPARMDTPEGLLAVLRRKLPDTGSATLSEPRQAAVSGTAPEPAAMAQVDPDPELALAPNQPATSIPAVGEAGDQVDIQQDDAPTSAGRFVIQLGAFSVPANAERLARETGGKVVSSGRLSLVHTGPYMTRGQAEAALAKLKSQGYRDALITTKN